ncbi:MAG TPA: hypothetical protein DDZ22_03135, partial [Massilia sp.]|nr:hypothetical protein [Massilia sp.]
MKKKAAQQGGRTIGQAAVLETTMNHPVIPIAVAGASRQRKREAPKGRRVDPQALAEVQALLG